MPAATAVSVEIFLLEQKLVVVVDRHAQLGRDLAVLLVAAGNGHQIDLGVGHRVTRGLGPLVHSQYCHLDLFHGAHPLACSSRPSLTAEPS